MTRPSQKKEELCDLKDFLRTIKLDGSFESGLEPNKAPDSWITSSGKRIAVEVTEFHSGEMSPAGHRRRAVEEEWSKRLFLSINSERLKYPDLAHIQGILFFRELDVPSRPESVQFTNELLHFSCTKAGSINKEATFYSFGSQYSLLDKYLHSIFFQKADEAIPPEDLFWHWNHDFAWVGFTNEELYNSISSKLGKARPEGAAENWLLLVSRLSPSQSMGLAPLQEFAGCTKTNEALAQGPFDKIYVFQRAYGRVLLWEPSTGWTEVCKPCVANGHE